MRWSTDFDGQPQNSDTRSNDDGASIIANVIKANRPRIKRQKNNGKIFLDNRGH